MLRALEKLGVHGHLASSVYVELHASLPLLAASLVQLSIRGAHQWSQACSAQQVGGGVAGGPPAPPPPAPPKHTAGSPSAIWRGDECIARSLKWVCVTGTGSGCGTGE